MNIDVLRWDAASPSTQDALRSLLHSYALTLQSVTPNSAIPGSYWGDDEAGLIGRTVYVRGDTPIHSVLHEACHAICMGHLRTETLHTDAGGDVHEESAVCYLQILLAEQITGFGAQRCCDDMDLWGYSFRLGSTRRWFEEDAQDAVDWLQQHQLWPEAANCTFTASAASA